MSQRSGKKAQATPRTTDSPQPATLAPDREFDFAEKLITQVATLASAILALSVTFAHDWSKAIGPHQKQLLRGSWILMALSLLAGLASLSALAGMAHSRRGDISSKSLRIPWLVQVVTFLLGLGLMVWLGLTLL